MTLNHDNIDSAVKEQLVISKRHNIGSLIVLILTNVLWGSSFILTKILTNNQIPIFFYIGLRFTIALLGFLPFVFRLKHITKSLLLTSLFTGFLYFFSILFQTYGLQYTTAGKAGFITGLGTVFVPFILFLAFKKPIKKKIWLAVALSIIGMAFLLLEGELILEISPLLLIGNILVFLCAVLYAFYIVFNDLFVKDNDIYAYTIIQLVVISVMGYIGSFIIGETMNLSSLEVNYWLVLMYMGLIVTSLTFIFQNWGQRYQNPTVTAIIFTLEPVFAILFGYLIGNEILSISGWIGSILIFCALLLAIPRNKRKISLEIRQN